MKLNEILTESPTDVVARFYKEASKKLDSFYNPENVKYKDETQEYYDEYFKNWFTKGTVPIFKKPVDKAQPKYSVLPKGDKLQSPGYRGLHYALARAGLPYNHKVQKYETDLARVLPVLTRNNYHT